MEGLFPGTYAQIPARMAASVADRVRLACKVRGMSPTSLEDGRLIKRGYISRLLDPERKTHRVGPEKMSILAAKLRVPHDWLASGRGDMNDPAVLATGPLPGMRPTLAQRPGYNDAEIAIARKRAKIPVEVFQQARGLMFADGGPEAVTEEFLDDLVQFLARHPGATKK